MARLNGAVELTNPVHMIKFEKTVASGADWHLVTSDWVVLQLCEGIAYAFDSKASKELPLGGVMVCPPKAEITMTASVLGRAMFRGMAIRVGSLTGFLTALERRGLETVVARECAPFVALPSEHPLARRVTQTLGQEQTLSLSSRLAFAQTFAELVGPQLQEALNQGKEEEKNQQDAKGRLRQFISQMPESELSSFSLGQMAKLLHCCERHASRLFREEWGKGFLSYVSDLRLQKACHLLRQGNLKIIDVALESGHGSLAHFNYVFKRRFGVTPTEWREREKPAARRSPRAKALQMAAMVAGLLCGVAGILGGGRAAAAESEGASQPAADASTNAPAAAAAMKFPVDRYEVRGNTLLPTNVISRVLAAYTGQAVDTNTIAKAVGALQLEYHRRGYGLTVKVVVPTQKVTNNTIVLEAIEGKLTTIKILRNRYFSSNNIMASLPYVKTLELGKQTLNEKVFQGELDRANSNPDLQILPEIRPGVEPGTSALILTVQDRLPLHGRLDWDNYSPPGTPEQRINANLSYGNLWQLDHTLGVQYGFSPEAMKPSLGEDTHLSLNPLDRPDVTYYSGFYRAPLGAPSAVEEETAWDQTQFGYNETTKRFMLPPSIGRPEFTAYASRSTTGPTILGPESTVVQSSLLTIDQQLITQQYTSQTTAGARLSFPLPTWKGIQSSWSVGVDYKEDKVVTLPTNNFYYTTVVSHGSSGGTTTTRNTISIAGVPSYPALQYTPLFFGWSGSRPDPWGQFGGGVSVEAGTGGTLSRERAFPILIANKPEATTEFVAVRPQLSRLERLPDNFILYGSLSGQWADEPLLNLEQLALGGNSTVRGYREGELYADTGWVGQVELRSPIYKRGETKQFGTQLTVFSDYGQGYELDQDATPGKYEALWGVGAGLNFTFGAHVESHILVAWPLLNSAYTAAGHERISFSVIAQL